MKKFILAILIAFSLFFCCACKASPSADKLGVWWWNANLDADKYLDFAEENSVAEIYYCDDGFDEDTAEFIENANGRNMKVYYLSGDYRWLRDSKSLYAQLENYKKFQSDNKNRSFKGVHLDIEPHQDPLFSKERKFLLTSLISLVYKLKEDFPEIKFDYDIPFWLDDEITFDGETFPAYAHIIKNADRTFIMSYRDSAEKIYSVAKDEVNFGKSVDKTVVCCVETYSEEGDGVSFMEEGKKYMYGEIEKLRDIIPENSLVAIHQIKTWYDLKD